jgi:acetyl esterase/lipase
MDLWKGFTYPGEKAGPEGTPDGFRPTLDAYILKSGAKRPAVLVLPGSGYVQCSSREAEALAIRFNAAGYHSFVLWYSCAPRRHPIPILDCSRAFTVIRENAAEWKIDPSRIAMMGFSAGGHLALSQTLFHDRPFAVIEGVNPRLARSDALLLCYPVITSGDTAHRGSFDALLGPEKKDDPALLELLSLEKQVSSGQGQNLPPVFLWHTWTDDAVPVENALLLASALKKAEIPMEMHLFPEGRHGLSLADRETEDGDAGNVNPHAAQWFGLCLAWLKKYFS